LAVTTLASLIHQLFVNMRIDEELQLALKHLKTGNLQQAENIFRDVLESQPENVTALHFMGVIYYKLKNYTSAQMYIKKALQLEPTYVDAYCNLGIVLQDQGYLDEAIPYYQKAIEINPDFVLAHYNIGEALRQKGHLDKAIQCYQKALKINPNIAEVYHGLGDALQEKGLLHEAIRCYQKALQINPNSVGVYCNLANVLQEQGHFDEAVECCQSALQLSPNSSLAYYILGDAFVRQGRKEEALTAYHRAIDCNPNFVAARFALCNAQIPIIYSTQSEIQISRERYHNELVKLSDALPLKTTQDIEAAASAVGRHMPFFLAYQGFNDRELQKIYGNLLCRIMSLRYPQLANRPVMPKRMTGERIRIGIVSGFYYNHSNWKIPIRGWVKNLDRRRFSIFGYYTEKTNDAVTEIARQRFDRFVEGIHNLENLSRIIRDDNLHVLMYPEIGMDPKSARLAALRLAPIQCTSWGHPDTSGLPTIDYFLSSDLMEPSDGEDHYREKLVRLPNLSINYTPLDVEPVTATRETFGFRKDALLYLCCQSLMKYLPQYDELYPRIALEIRNCQFLFITSHTQSITEQFRSRLKKAFEHFHLDADEYIIMLPRLDSGQYQAINRLSDIYLDSIEWTGCNSTLEAIAWNLPIVTIPGKMMRGRHSYAILTMMEVTDTLASSLDEYISLAIRLGNDAAWRNEISQKIAANKHRLYNDRTCVTALEDFLERVVKEYLY
jgi:protein O-GlcNAc transferase